MWCIVVCSRIVKNFIKSREGLIHSKSISEPGMMTPSDSSKEGSYSVPGLLPIASLLLGGVASTPTINEDINHGEWCEQELLRDEYN